MPASARMHSPHGPCAGREGEGAGVHGVLPKLSSLYCKQSVCMIGDLDLEDGPRRLGPHANTAALAAWPGVNFIQDIGALRATASSSTQAL